MDKQGFLEFNARYSPKNSGKADSYVRAINILDEVLPHLNKKDLQDNKIDLQGRSLYDISESAILEEILRLVNDEVEKMKKGEKNIFDYSKPTQKSYPRKNFCSAALKSLIDYAKYDQFKKADGIVERGNNPRNISSRLIAHFDITKEGEDVISKAKIRKGQDYFRRMVLANYNGKCGLTGIDIPELLVASHIKPWADDEKNRLNPENGICLSSLYDKAFDKGLMSFRNDLTALFSEKLEANVGKDYYIKYFEPIKNKKLVTPNKYHPNPEFLEWHRDCIFNK